MAPVIRERRTWGGWLYLGSGVLIVGGALPYAVLGTVSALFGDPFPPALIGVFLFPIFVLIAETWRERKIDQFRPTYKSGPTSQILIRNLTDGSATASVPGTSLRGVSFVGVSLRGACLWGEDLSEAKLYGIDLQHSYLRAAILNGADLRGADLRGADLNDALLHNADLRGAILTGASLRAADLEGAIYDDHTQWPTRFLPSERGCIRASYERSELPIPASHGQPETSSLPIPDRSGCPR